MKEIIFLLIITVVVLGFLSSDIIPLFRSSMEVIGTVAEKEYENQKVKKGVIVPLEKEVVIGGDVIGVIRYFSDNPNVIVKVTIGGDTEIYTNSIYSTTQFNIPYEKVFQCSYYYTGDKLKEARYIAK